MLFIGLLAGLPALAVLPFTFTIENNTGEALRLCLDDSLNSKIQVYPAGAKDQAQVLQQSKKEASLDEKTANWVVEFVEATPNGKLRKFSVKRWKLADPIPASLGWNVVYLTVDPGKTKPPFAPPAAWGRDDNDQPKEIVQPPLVWDGSHLTLSLYATARRRGAVSH
jgi:hypothetical protein